MIIPSSGDDIARDKWGDSWRIPTVAEMEELVKNCTWEWTIKMNGHNGYKITGPNGNSIFLPADGYRSDNSCHLVNWDGYYWSNMLSTKESYKASCLHFNDVSRKNINMERAKGLSIRPVKE